MSGGDSPLVLHAGRTEFTLPVQPQRAGVYVSGALTAQLGRVRLRTSFSTPRGLKAEAEEHLNSDRPLKALLKVGRSHG